MMLHVRALSPSRYLVSDVIRQAMLMIKLHHNTRKSKTINSIFAPKVAIVTRMCAKNKSH